MSMAELLQHLTELVLGGCVAEPQIAVHILVLTVGGGVVLSLDCLALLPRGAATLADDDGAVEAFREIDQVLAAVDVPEQLGYLVQRAHQSQDVVPVIGPSDRALHATHGLFQSGFRLDAPAPSGATARGGSPMFRHVCEGDSQGIPPRVDQLRQSESVDCHLDLLSIGGKAEDQVDAAGGRVGRNTDKVGRIETGGYQLLRGVSGPHDGGGIRERKIEEQEEVPSSGCRNTPNLLGLLDGSGRKVIGVESDQILTLSAIEDLELIGGQASDW
jgi:hypothetical protein